MATQDVPRGILITGTDTGVGKTRVSVWLALEMTRRGQRLGVCKPVATGAQDGAGGRTWEDTEALRAACPLTPRAEEVTPIRLEEPLAPPVAARRDPAWQSRSLRLGDYQDAVRAWAGRCDWLLVEGVGGLLCPITETETLADLAVWWGEPVVIVARLGLGTLNHTLLTIEAAQTRGLDVVGVVVNRSDPAPLSVADETNPAEMRRLLPCPVWGPIDFLASDATIPGAVVSMADAILERLAKS